VARVISRLKAIRGDLRQPSRWRKLQGSADQLLLRESAGDWNQAMMELGATVCTPRSPQCLLCPVAKFCQARKLGIAGSLPEKQKKRATVRVQLVSAILLDPGNNSLLLPPPETHGKGKSDDHVPSLVARLRHFPTVSATARPERALEQLLGRELGMKPAQSNGAERLDGMRHAVTYRTISVVAYFVRVRKLPKIRGAECVPLREIPRLAISNLTRKIARAALKHLSSEHSGTDRY
jgi:A/G-specific adenine glycosylase